MNDLSLFCTDDLYDGNNMVQVSGQPCAGSSGQSLLSSNVFRYQSLTLALQVMFCIQDFMRFSQEHSGHFLHPVYDEHMTFSNQEVRCRRSSWLWCKIYGG